jgi:hypothetical protein
MPLYVRVGAALAMTIDGAFCAGSAGAKQLPPSAPAPSVSVDASPLDDPPLDDPPLDDPPLDEPPLDDPPLDDPPDDPPLDDDSGAGAEESSLPEHAATSAHPTKSAVTDRMVD